MRGSIRGSERESKGGIVISRTFPKRRGEVESIRVEDGHVARGFGGSPAAGG